MASAAIVKVEGDPVADVVLAVSIGLAAVSYRLIERPFLQRKAALAG